MSLRIEVQTINRINGQEFEVYVLERFGRVYDINVGTGQYDGTYETEAAADISVEPGWSESDIETQMDYWLDSDPSSEGEQRRRSPDLEILLSVMVRNDMINPGFYFFDV